MNMTQKMTYPKVVLTGDIKTSYPFMVVQFFNFFFTLAVIVSRGYFPACLLE